MTLRLWNELHKDMSMATDKKNKTVLILANIGTNDLQKFGITEAYQEGEVVVLPEESADKLIRAGVAVEYTDEVQKEVEAKKKAAHDAAVAAALPAAERELALEAAKEEATKKAKAAPAKPIIHEPKKNP